MSGRASTSPPISTRASKRRALLLLECGLGHFAATWPPGPECQPLCSPRPQVRVLQRRAEVSGHSPSGLHTALQETSERAGRSCVSEIPGAASRSSFPHPHMPNPLLLIFKGKSMREKKAQIRRVDFMTRIPPWREKQPGSWCRLGQPGAVSHQPRASVSHL